MKYKTGAEFLNHLNQNMHMEQIIMHTATKSDTPTEKVEKYLKRLERTHDMAKNSPEKMKHLKHFYYQKYITKELPESYINLQKKIAYEEGYGNITVTEEMKQKMLTQVQEEQKHSLDSWLEYFCSDDAMYPMWFKNYAFSGMLKLGKFDKEKREFTKRSKTTVTPYLELNREVLAQVYNTLTQIIGKEGYELTESEEKALAEGESFKKLYTYYLRNTEVNERSEEIEGIWIKYDQGSDYHPLWESLQEKNTGWCTAGELTAKSQLKSGDFYVYYTKDKNNDYTNPRIAIRMNGKNEIAEVRGIEKDQNLESNMEDILYKKLDEFSDKEQYQKKVRDMKLLTLLERKQEQNLEFTEAELRFLYEIGDTIKGFGWKKDPRIEKIKEKRNLKKDLAIIFKVSEEVVGTKISDFSRNKKISVFYGDLVYNHNWLSKAFSNLKYIIGNASFEKLTSAKNLSALTSISGDAKFLKLKNAKGLQNLQSISGNAYFFDLKSTEYLNQLQSIGKDACFDKLINAKGLESLQYIGYNACFYQLNNVEGLKKLQFIGKNANFQNLPSAKGLESLQTIGEDAYFPKLENAKGLNNLKTIGMTAYFPNLVSADALKQLQYIGRDAYFQNLFNANDLESLKYIGRDAYFQILTKFKSLNQ